MPVPEKDSPESKIAELEKLVREIEQQRTVLGDVVAEPAIARLQTQITALKAQTIGDLESAYLRHIVESLNLLSLSGIDPKATGLIGSRLTLTDIYVPLYTLTLASRERERERELQQPKDKPCLSAIEALAREPRLVLLGDPGSGKSTFVNYVATCLANARLQRSDEWLTRLNDWPHGSILPVLIRVRELAKVLGPDKISDTARVLLSYIEQELQTWNLADYLPELQQSLLEGGALVLVDGLDEASEVEWRRERIRRIITDFASSFPRCRILVTSRTYAYQRQVWRLPGFTEDVLAPFTDEQIAKFVDHWYAHIAALRHLSPDHAQGRAELLKRAIFYSEQLGELAAYPLLLTLIASLDAWRGGSLPERREELYADAVDLLLDQWESQKVVRDTTGTPVVRQPSLAEWLKVDRQAVRAVLARLAFEAHRDQPQLMGTADIAEVQLIMNLMSVTYTPDINPARLVEYLRDRSGLLMQRGEGVYTFPHRTFQEYLAAVYMVDHDYPDLVVDLVRSDPSRWREVTLLAASKAGRGTLSAIWVLVEALCPTDRMESEADWMALIIAAEILAAEIRSPIPERHRPKQQRIQFLLTRLLTEGRLNIHERTRAGELLAIIGDPRSGIGVLVDGLPDVVFVQVPAGPCLLGSAIDDKDAYDDERPQHIVDLPAFLISRYPITNAQYYAFVADSGYDNPHYWSREGWGWRTGKPEVDSLSEPVVMRGQPLSLDPRLRIPTRPAVGLSWYEATAYCRWFTEKLRSSGKLRSSEHARLPTEAEWEKAARGGVDIPKHPLMQPVMETSLLNNSSPIRRLPWGDQMDPERCNFIETGIGATTVVGTFPAGSSPYGVEDMAGNVWEWTNSAVAHFPYKPDDGREDPGTDKPRVIRGGSWRSYPTQVRAASRVGLVAGDRRDDVGFRVVISPLIKTDYPIGVSRVLTPVLDFFSAAGFDVSDASQNDGILVPRDAYNLRRLGPKCYVRVVSERVAHREDIEALVETIKTRYENQLSDRTAFIVLDTRPDIGAHLQMFTYRFSDNFTIVPFTASQLRQALQTDSCSEILKSVLGNYLGETDLYKSQWPVSDALGFFGRKPVIDTIKHILDRGEHVALFGLRKMGKTSLLNYQHAELPYPTAVLSLQDVRKLPEICREAITEWRKALLQRLPGITIPNLNLTDDPMPSDVKAAFRSDAQTLLDLLEKHRVAPRLVLCLDEIDVIVPSDESSSEAIAEFCDLVGFLRGIATRFKSLNLIVCGMRPDINRVNYWQKQSNPVFQSFQEIFLGPFSKKENDEMVTGIGAPMGVDYEPDALERLYLESGGHPFIARQMCSLAVAEASSRPYTFRLDDVSSAAKEYLHNPSTANYVERELWGSIHNQAEAEVLMELAKRQPQTETELIPTRLPKSKQLARRRALANLNERWLLKSDASGYFIPYDCFRRWIRLNYLEES